MLRIDGSATISDQCKIDINFKKEMPIRKHKKKMQVTSFSITPLTSWRFFDLVSNLHLHLLLIQLFSEFEDLNWFFLYYDNVCHQWKVLNNMIYLYNQKKYNFQYYLFWMIGWRKEHFNTTLSRYFKNIHSQSSIKKEYLLSHRPGSVNVTDSWYFDTVFFFSKLK